MTGTAGTGTMGGTGTMAGIGSTDGTGKGTGTTAAVAARGAIAALHPGAVLAARGTGASSTQAGRQPDGHFVFAPTALPRTAALSHLVPGHPAAAALAVALHVASAQMHGTRFALPTVGR